MSAAHEASQDISIALAAVKVATQQVEHAMTRGEWGAISRGSAGGILSRLADLEKDLGNLSFRATHTAPTESL